MPRTDAGTAVPGGGATVLLTDHARLELPTGAVPAGSTIRFVEGVPIPALPPEYQALFAWHKGRQKTVRGLLW